MNIDFKRVFSLRLRRRIRRRAKDGLFVVFENTPGKHQIDDISSGGLSYHYIDGGMRPKNGAYALRVISGNRDQTVRLTGKIISDRETGELVAHNQKIKRRSVRFEPMNNHQKKVLKDIIKEYTTARRSF